MTDLVTELKKIQPTTKRTQQIAFVFAFLALLVDGADMLLLSFSLNSLKAEFGLSNLQAGALGSATLAGMAVGGFLSGWACPVGSGSDGSDFNLNLFNFNSRTGLYPKF